MPAIAVQVPAGVGPGQQFLVEYAGQRIGVTVPPGVAAGQQIQVQAPEPPAAGAGGGDTIQVDVEVPPGVQAGQQIEVQTPGGRVRVAIPPGVAPGQKIRVQVPKPAGSKADIQPEDSSGKVGDGDGKADVKPEHSSKDGGSGGGGGGGNGGDSGDGGGDVGMSPRVTLTMSNTNTPKPPDLTEEEE